jgi:hypothetical protein
MNDLRTYPTQLTIRSFWQYLGVKISTKRDPAVLQKALAQWPPDLFALTAGVLRKSGAYISAMNFLGGGKAIDEARAKARQAAGQCWRARLDSCGDDEVVKTPWDGIPGDLETYKVLFRVLVANLDLEIHKICDRPEVCDALMDLMAVADEACVGVGLPLREAVLPKDEKPSVALGSFWRRTDRELFPKQFGSTLCKTVLPSVARVLPKLHTAQCGLTLRSFSHHLAYVDSVEVQPSWVSVPGSRGDVHDVHRMNLLIVPWPELVTPAHIAEVPNDRNLPYNRFTVDITSTGGAIAERLCALVEQAAAAVGPLDAVVLPELALDSNDYRCARAVLLRRKIMLIAGVGSKRRSANSLYMDVPVSASHALGVRQRKHHRWKLERQQIHRYHLGSPLNPEKEYWEHIDVQHRMLHFIVLRPWLVAAPLICEDLARHDPVGDMLKSVGPNLVLALLMDGPQLVDRWSSRYAAVLADDPGCSVLSITSLGMASLSRPNYDRKDSSRVIGLWKDAFSGATEIELAKDHHGVVLTLAMRQHEEKTADSRSNSGIASYPSLSGINQVKLPERMPPMPTPLPEPEWLSIHDAHLLAELVQTPSIRQIAAMRKIRAGKTGLVKLKAERHALHPGIMPDALKHLQGSAFRIGREIWRRKTGRDRPEGMDPENETSSQSGSWATSSEELTAEEIINWHDTNCDEELARGSGAHYRS